MSAVCDHSGLSLVHPAQETFPHISEERDRKSSRSQDKGDENMLGIIAAVLIVLWLLGFFAFHVTSGLIHIVLVVGLIMLILHFVRGRTATA
jgi:Family of unknown function (DUF5670)